MDQELYNEGSEKLDASKERQMVAVFADIGGFSTAVNTLKRAGKKGVWRRLISRLSELGEGLATKYDVVHPVPEGDSFFWYDALTVHEDGLTRMGELALEFRDAFQNDNAIREILAENPEINLTLHMAVDYDPEGELFPVKPRLGRDGYLPIGDGINRCARLMKFDGADPNLVYTSGEFADALLRQSRYLQLAPVKKSGRLVGIEAFKGVGRTAVYQVLGRNPGAPRGRVLSRTTLLGREDELKELSDSVSSLSDGKPFALMIKEEAGSGKSRLVHELKQKEPALFIDFNFNELQSREPYSVIKDVIRSRPLSQEQQQALKDDIPFIQDIVDPTKPKTEYLVTPERRHAALYKLLQTYTVEDRPTVFVAEDLHWADQESVEFLKYVSALLLEKEGLRSQENYNTKPIGLIITTRPDLKTDIGQRLELKPLDPENSRQLLKSTLGQEAYKELEEISGDSTQERGLGFGQYTVFADRVVGKTVSIVVKNSEDQQIANQLVDEGQACGFADLGLKITVNKIDGGQASLTLESQKLVEDVIELSQGNPFSLEQRAQAYLESRDHEALLLTPSTLTQIIRARKDKLRRVDLKVALEYISVLGSYSRDFDSDILFRLSPEAKSQKGVRLTQETADQLEESGWVTHIREGRYQIRHHSIQEAVYRELGNRAEALHREIARRLEQRAFSAAARKISDLTGLQVSPHAVKLLFIEDDYNKKREVIKDFLKDKVADKPLTDTEVEKIVNQVLTETVPVEEIAHHWEHSENHTPKGEKEIPKLRALTYLAKARAKAANEPHSAVRHSERSLAILDENVKLLEQDVDAPLRSATIKARKEEKIRVGTCLASVIGSTLGDYERAGSIYQELLDLSQQIGKGVDRDTNNLRLRLGIVHRNRGDFDQAEKQFAELRKIAEASQGIDDTADYFFVSAEANLGHVLYTRHRKEKSRIEREDREPTEPETQELRKLAEQALQVFERTSSHIQSLKETPSYKALVPAERFLLNSRANALGELGRWQDALDLCEQYLEAIKGDTAEESVAHTNIGECYLKLGDLERAEDHLLTGLELARKVGHGKDIVYACENLLELYGRKGQGEQALVYGKEALKLSGLIWGEKDTEGRILSIRKVAKAYKMDLAA